MSAHARWHGGSSCGHNCGWNMLSGLCAFALIGGVWALIKGAFAEGSFILGALSLVFGGGILIAALFLGPVVIVGGIIAVVVAVLAWVLRDKKA
jgi:hypothetical protein